MRILVTGGAGFIGSHTIKALIAAGDEVLAIDNLSRGQIIPEPPARFLKVDLFSPEFEAAWQEFRPEAVLHLAAQIDVQSSWECPAVDLRQNTESTVRILELSRSLGPVKLIFASSAAVYGSASGRLSERSPLMPCSPYGLSKRMAEEYIQLWATRWDIPWLILRYANVYGPYPEDQNSRGVCRIFAQNLRDGLPLLVYGSGKQIRDFVSVYDVAQANVLACHSELQDEVLNISSGKGVSVLETLNLMVEVSALTPQIHFVTEGDAGVKYNVLSPARAIELLQWEAKWSLIDGFMDLWKKF